MIDGKPRIGDEVYIHGYIDEIRKDVVIIRNDGGYFGTAPSEVARYIRPHIYGKESKMTLIDWSQSGKE